MTDFLKLLQSTAAQAAEATTSIAADIVGHADSDKAYSDNIKKQLKACLDEQKPAIMVAYKTNQDLAKIIELSKEATIIQTSLATADEADKPGINASYADLTGKILKILKSLDPKLNAKVMGGVDPNTLFIPPNATPVVECFQTACNKMMANVLDSTSMRRSLASLHGILAAWLEALLNVRFPKPETKKIAGKRPAGAGASVKTPKAPKKAKAPLPSLLNNSYFCDLTIQILDQCMALPAMRHVIDMTSVKTTTLAMIQELRRCSDTVRALDGLKAEAEKSKKKSAPAGGAGAGAAPPSKFGHIDEIKELDTVRKSGESAKRYTNAIKKAEQKAAKKAKKKELSKELSALHVEQRQSEAELIDAIKRAIRARGKARSKEQELAEVSPSSATELQMSNVLGFLYSKLNGPFDKTNRAIHIVFPAPKQTGVLKPIVAQHLLICPVLEADRRNKDGKPLPARYVTEYVSWSTQKIGVDDPILSRVDGPRKLTVAAALGQTDYIARLTPARRADLDLESVKMPTEAALATPVEFDGDLEDLATTPCKRSTQIFTLAMVNPDALSDLISALPYVDDAVAAYKAREGAPKDDKAPSLKKRRGGESPIPVGADNDESKIPDDDEKPPSPSVAPLATPPPAQGFSFGLNPDGTPAETPTPAGAPTPVFAPALPLEDVTQ